MNIEPNKMLQFTKSVYKINYVINGIIDTVYVFYGKNNAKEKEIDMIKKVLVEKSLNFKDSIKYIKQNNL
jgi:hypothetical protein